MRERLKKKIRSNSGASIAIALLLFLVCAAVGAVVLTAGTAASGHASQQEEMDRRYYSVLSAAELVRDQLDGQTYTIERTKTDTVSETVTYGEDGKIVYGDSVSGDPVYSSKCTFQYKDKTGNADRSDSLLSEAVFQYVYGDESAYVTSGYSTSFGYGASPCNDKDGLTTMTLTLGSGSKALAVDMKADLKPDGSLLITLVHADAGDKFTVELTMNAAFSDNSYAPSVHSSSSSVSSDNTITTMTTTVTTKTSAISWTAGPVRVVEGGA